MFLFSLVMTGLVHITLEQLNYYRAQDESFDYNIPSRISKAFSSKLLIKESMKQ